MRDLVTDSDMAQIRHAYPDKHIVTPSAMHQRILMMYMRGMSRGAIAAAVGEMGGYDAPKAVVNGFLNSPTAKALIDLYREREFRDARVSRDYLTTLLFESYHKAGTVLEEIAAIREIGKMNGIYESDKQQGSNVTINQIGNIQNVKQLERLSEEELSKLANDIGVVLDPSDAARKDLPKLPPTEEKVLPP